MANEEAATWVAPGIRRMTAADAERVSDWLNRPSIRRLLTSNLRDGGMTPALVRAALRRPDQMWTVFCDDEGEPIGLIALDSIDRADGVANVWYVLGNEILANRGLTSAALERFLKANPMGLATLTAWVGEPNVGSMNCLLRAGFRQVGRISNAFVVEGARHDRLIFERVLEE